MNDRVRLGDIWAFGILKIHYKVVEIEDGDCTLENTNTYEIIHYYPINHFPRQGVKTESRQLWKLVYRETPPFSDEEYKEIFV